MSSLLNLFKPQETDQILIWTYNNTNIKLELDNNIQGVSKISGRNVKAGKGDPNKQS